MWLQRLRFELGMKLAADEMRMVRQFDHLDVRAVRRRTGDSQSCSRQLLFILAIELVTMAVPLTDFRLTVNSMRQRPRLDLAGQLVQPHGSTHFFDSAQSAPFAA